ncbi:MAG: MFS transporter [Paludibacter sp.]|jgi:fucose permease
MKKNYWIVALIMLFWFVISFITNIMGPLIPDVIQNFHLSYLGLAGFIPTSFFVAYAVMSIPSGILIEKLNQKIVLIIGFTLPLIGSLLFAIHPSYITLLLSSFIIGLGMAMLQTVINPLTRVAGGEENFAFFSVFGQLVFGAASFVSPLLYSYLVQELTTNKNGQNLFVTFLAKLTPPELPWASLYWVFALILIAIIVITFMVRFPSLELNEDEKSGSVNSYKTLLKNKYVYLFFFGILSYVATEQGIANWISQFLFKYHGLNPQVVGAQEVGWFWGLMSVGCLIGLFALKLFDSKYILRVSATISIALLFLSLFSSKEIALIGFPALGFTISVMFSIIMSLGLNSVSSHHGSFAGILCTGIVGGAIGPLIVGNLADIVGLKLAMLVILLPMAYIFGISVWAKPLIQNKTVKLNQLFKK